MGTLVVRITAGVALGWLLLNAFLAGKETDWSSPLLWGILAVFALIAINPLGWGSRRSGQPPPPTPEERVGHLEEEMGRHQAEHAWERWLEFLKELFSRREEGPKEGQGGLLLPGLLVAVVLIGAMFFFGIIPMSSFTLPAPAATPRTFQVGGKVQVADNSIRGYSSLSGASAGIPPFTSNLGRQVFVVKEQAGEFTWACFDPKLEITCWWFPTKGLRPATAPTPTRMPTRTPASPWPTGTPRLASP